MIVKRSVIISFILLRSFLPVLAQQELRLSDIKAIKLEVQPGGITHDHQTWVLVYEGQKWRCYQTLLVMATLRGMINDSSRTFLREVPEPVLLKLVALVNDPKSAPDIKLFNIDNGLLIKYLDGLAGFSLSQKETVIKQINSTDILDKAFYNIYHPLFKMMDDRTSLSMNIITKDDHAIQINATQFGYIDFEPWYFMGTLSYDPSIAAVFGTITGEDTPTEAQKRIYTVLAKELYYQIYNKRAR